MRYTRILPVFFLLLLVRAGVFCQNTTDLTITTYYPAPYGVYKNPSFFPHDKYTPGSACRDEGTMYYDKSDALLYICSGQLWKPVPGKTPAPAGGDLPSGMIAMFDQDCPGGWTRAAGLDGRIPRGAAVYAAVDGPAVFGYKSVGTGKVTSPSLNVQGIAFDTANGTLHVPSCCNSTMGATCSCSSANAGGWYKFSFNVPRIGVVWCKKN